ncbi:MAG TPA: pilus assembly protein N-terminal domain-containing protein [Afifellaceae bacterium]|nr:pilus assembly protein N-terminal domain-containing protein [Afifellaceae bacterium]
MINTPKSLLAFAMAVGLSFLGSAGKAAETIDVRLGYSELIRTEKPAETIIIGNDQVANATIASAGTIVVTGNALGSTNLILLDETGAEISSATVRVVPVDPRPQHAVRLILGGANQGAAVYVCGPEPGCVQSQSGEGDEPVSDDAQQVVEMGDEAQSEEAR